MHMKSNIKCLIGLAPTHVFTEGHAQFFAAFSKLDGKMIQSSGMRGSEGRFVGRFLFVQSPLVIEKARKFGNGEPLSLVRGGVSLEVTHAIHVNVLNGITEALCLAIDGSEVVCTITCPLVKGVDFLCTCGCTRVLVCVA